MSKILVISEGRKTEPKLLKTYLGKIKSERPDLDDCDLEIVPYKTNIYVLYKKLSDFISDGIVYSNTLDILKMIYKESPSKELNDILKNKYPYIYLIFDFEIQDTLYTDEEKYNILLEMKKVFNDETENGFLIINFPMIESYRHFKTFDNIDEEFKNSIITKDQSYNYKKFLNKNGNILDINRYNLNCFESLVRVNIKKINQLLYDKYELIEYESLINILLENRVLDKEIEKVKNKNQIYVICLTLFIFLMYYGEKYYNCLIIDN